MVNNTYCGTKTLLFHQKVLTQAFLAEGIYDNQSDNLHLRLKTCIVFVGTSIFSGPFS